MESFQGNPPGTPALDRSRAVPPRKQHVRSRPHRARGAPHRKPTTPPGRTHLVPSGAACSNLPAAWAMEPEELKKGFFACYPVLTIGAMLGILAAVLMLIRRWKPIYDDRAQKTWVAGDCLVVDRVTLSGSSDSQTKEYQIIIKVLSDFLMLGPPHHSFL